MSALLIIPAGPLAASLLGALLSIIPMRRFEEGVSAAAAILAVLFALLSLGRPDGANALFYIDGVSKIMSLTVSLIYLGAVVYSITYLKHLENPLFQKGFYYFLVNMFAATMLFTVVAANLGLMWVGIEATTITSALLVATENNDTTIEAAWRYIIIASSGLVISLVSIVLLYASRGTLDLSVYLRAEGGGRLFTIGAALAIVGYGTKAGLFPLGTWLPDVHGRAPAPVSALFSSVLVPVAMYGIFRVVEVAPAAQTRLFLLVFGLLTVGTAAFLLARQDDYKRMFAYSTAESMGIILIGLGSGTIGALGALVVLIAHAFAKSAVFFLSGNLLARYKSTRIREIRGVATRMPRTAYTLLFAALAVTGAPPFGVAVAVVIGAFLVLAFIAVNRRIVQMLFSEDSGTHMERGRVGTLVPIVNVILSLAAIAVVPLLPGLLSGVAGK